MKVRSPRLLAIGLAMLACGAALAALLHHDGEVGLAGDPEEAQAGELLGLKGTVAPWTPPPAQKGAWGELARHLGNATYEVRQDDASVLVLATYDEAVATAVGHKVVEGQVSYAATLPGPRHVVVLWEPELHDPLVFR